VTLKSILIQIIEGTQEYNDFAFVYAQRSNGIFTTNSEAVILRLSEDEMELNTKIISKKYCPKKEYFLEVFSIKEMLEGITKTSSSDKIDKRIKTIIDYAENDA